MVISRHRKGLPATRLDIIDASAVVGRFSTVGKASKTMGLPDVDSKHVDTSEGIFWFIESVVETPASAMMADGCT